LRKAMPEEDFKVLSAYYDVLPGQASPPLYPFAGYVVNFNIVTRAHRDHHDEGFCLVLALQDGKGGDLVLQEPGIVVRMRSGDCLLFRSANITHFNLHFTGTRMSIVFHSDRDGRSWVRNRNNW
ncbi:hypothetical protein CYLTODRAFT_315268, partial [Cylindrobasidium torrendii FP15055 ss-10]